MFVQYAVVMVFIYPIGVPFIFYIYLYNRKDIIRKKIISDLSTPTRYSLPCVLHTLINMSGQPWTHGDGTQARGGETYSMESEFRPEFTHRL